MIMNKYNWRWELLDLLYNNSTILLRNPGNNIVASDGDVFYTFRMYGHILVKSQWRPLFQYMDTLNEAASIA